MQHIHLFSIHTCYISLSQGLSFSSCLPLQCIQWNCSRGLWWVVDRLIRAAPAQPGGRWRWKAVQGQNLLLSRSHWRSSLTSPASYPLWWSDHRYQLQIGLQSRKNKRKRKKRMILSVNCVELLKGTAFAEKSVFAQTHVKQSVFNKKCSKNWKKNISANWIKTLQFHTRQP